MFTPNPGEMIQCDEHIFQMGWFNHQLDTHRRFQRIFEWWIFHSPRVETTADWGIETHFSIPSIFSEAIVLDAQMPRRIEAAGGCWFDIETYVWTWKWFQMYMKHDTQYTFRRLRIMEGVRILFSAIFLVLGLVITFDLLFSWFFWCDPQMPRGTFACLRTA